LIDEHSVNKESVGKMNFVNNFVLNSCMLNNNFLPEDETNYRIIIENKPILQTNILDHTINVKKSKDFIEDKDKDYKTNYNSFSFDKIDSNSSYYATLRKDYKCRFEDIKDFSFGDYDKNIILINQKDESIKFEDNECNYNENIKQANNPFLSDVKDITNKNFILNECMNIWKEKENTDIIKKINYSPIVKDDRDLNMKIGFLDINNKIMIISNFKNNSFIRLYFF